MRCHRGEEDCLSDAEHVVGRKNEAAVESEDRKLVVGLVEGERMKEWR